MYVLWDGEFIYIAIEIYDDDLIERSKAYTQWEDAKGDTNPYYNDGAEIWYCFEQRPPESMKDVKKACYDAYGVGDGPFSSASEAIYSNHFFETKVAATANANYDPEAEDGLIGRSVIEFKIPAKMEDGSELWAGDEIYFAVQLNDIAEASVEELKARFDKNPNDFPKDFDPANPETYVDESGIKSGYVHTWTRARTQFLADGELNGYCMATLTEIVPESAAE